LFDFIVEIFKMSQDEAIRATNDDAAVCKRCAIQLGYWTDPYLPYFIKSADRKPPEINRGYYARVYAIQILLQQFIDVRIEKFKLMFNFNIQKYKTLI